MRVFTTCRDAAGPVVGVQKAIDAGLIPGPRTFFDNHYIVVWGTSIGILV